MLGRCVLEGARRGWLEELESMHRDSLVASHRRGQRRARAATEASRQQVVQAAAAPEGWGGQGWLEQEEGWLAPEGDGRGQLWTGDRIWPSASEDVELTIHSEADTDADTDGVLGSVGIEMGTDNFRGPARRPPRAPLPTVRSPLPAPKPRGRTAAIARGRTAAVARLRARSARSGFRWEWPPAPHAGAPAEVYAEVEWPHTSPQRPAQWAVDVPPPPPRGPLPPRARTWWKP